MTHIAYDLWLPHVVTTGVVFASPHSGSDYGQAFLAQARLDPHAIRSSEDAYVDQLFRTAPDHGAPLLSARTPRAFVDFNRAPDELDPALIEGAARLPHNPRVASGLGVIPRVVAGGRAIYSGKISLAQAHGRLTTHWRPWHDRLQALMDAARRDHGQAILIDCHSMPREALSQVGGRRPDVVIGDRFGASASAAVVAMIEAALTDAGLRVVRNMPFAGAYVTQAYGRPARRQHAVQIEIDRSLYMDEATLDKRHDFDDLQRVLDGAIATIAAAGRADAMAHAAE
ncbi:N-formylglutamate amidohydrolase [Loktanella fryxellensis]|uniref:N-formylglutamate amidohydrolase n=1 Tax=Loktanella fryxellensis TaxID=245187 RepID=A0A1H7ZYK6_9RHOB|nr:N-formylglutamate amidohydrolase [Loktanella fryxellensis]SEM62417.1 N-formylglutamate amidohydrolase [Loktanella fryxellensis]